MWLCSFTHLHMLRTFPVSSLSPWVGGGGSSFVSIGQGTFPLWTVGRSPWKWAYWDEGVWEQSHWDSGEVSMEMSLLRVLFLSIFTNVSMEPVTLYGYMFSYITGLNRKYNKEVKQEVKQEVCRKCHLCGLWNSNCFSCVGTSYHTTSSPGTMMIAGEKLSLRLVSQCSSMYSLVLIFWAPGNEVNLCNSTWKLSPW